MIMGRELKVIIILVEVVDEDIYFFIFYQRVQFWEMVDMYGNIILVLDYDKVNLIRVL